MAESLDVKLTVVVPFVRPPDTAACCGIRGRRWEQLVRGVAEEDAERARRLLEGEAIGHSITIADGSSIPEIVATFPAENSDVLVLPAISESLFSRRDLRKIADRARCTVQRLPGAARSGALP